MPVEICGNCLDDDANGLIDAEDPTCCGDDVRSNGTLKRGLLKPRKDGNTKLRLKATLGGSELVIDPPTEDVSLLVRAEGQPDVLCIRLPVGSFMQRGRRFRYKGPRKETNALRRVVIPVKKDGSVRYKAVGPQMIFPIDESGSSDLSVRVTVAFSSGTDAVGRCSTMTAQFRKRGRAYRAKGG